MTGDIMDARTITDSALVEQYQKILAHVTECEATLAEELKPYKEGMEIIKNEFLRRFHERGSTNSKTEFGTPYKSSIMNTKVVERTKFLQFCLDNWQSIGADMLHVAAVKDPVKKFIEEKQTTPPGVDVSYVERINIPKS